MNNIVNQRVKKYVDDNQISLNSLAKTLNMNQSTVLRQVKGEQTLSSNLVENFLSAFPDVSAEWLMRGIGSMNKMEEIDETPSMAAEDIHFHSVNEDSIWRAKYEELEKRYDQLLSILGGGMRQSKVNVG